MKEIDPKLLEELKAKHGDVVLLTAERAGIQIVCKSPTRTVYRKFKSDLADSTKKAVAFENLALTCLVHPARENFDRLLDELPALGDTFGIALADMVGGEDASAKKV